MKVAFYKGTRPGIYGLHNRLIRAVDGGPYSHCELVTSAGVSWSASLMDKGVRDKVIDFDPERWDFVEVPAHLEPEAIEWFEKHEKSKYDIKGNLHFMFWFIKHSTDKHFCSEAVAAALGIPDAWRLGPNGLYAVLTYITNHER